MAAEQEPEEEPRKERGRIPPTPDRDWFGIDHRPPRSGVDRTGRTWKGTSRIIDPPARRKSNKLTWSALLRRERQAARRLGQQVEDSESM